MIEIFQMGVKFESSKRIISWYTETHFIDVYL